MYFHISKLDCYDQEVIMRVVDLKSILLGEGYELILFAEALQWSLV